ncbi:hypothetical protein ACA910_004311 [Epithemia clementina (nom. ined.)]
MVIRSIRVLVGWSNPLGSRSKVRTTWHRYHHTITTRGPQQQQQQQPSPPTGPTTSPFASRRRWYTRSSTVGHGGGGNSSNFGIGGGGGGGGWNEYTYTRQSAAAAAAQAFQQNPHPHHHAGRNNAATPNGDPDYYDNENPENNAHLMKDPLPIMKRLPAHLHFKILPFVDTTQSDNKNAILGCWPLWMAEYQNVDYIIGKPVHPPVLIYWQPIVAPQPTQQQPHVEPVLSPAFQLPDPMYFDQAQNATLIQETLLPLFQKQLTQESKGRYSLQWTEHSLRLVDLYDIPPSMDEFERDGKTKPPPPTPPSSSSQEQHNTGASATVNQNNSENKDGEEKTNQGSSGGDEGNTSSNSNDEQHDHRPKSPSLLLQREAFKLVTKLEYEYRMFWLVRPLFPTLHAAACIRYTVTASTSTTNTSTTTQPSTSNQPTETDQGATATAATPKNDNDFFVDKDDDDEETKKNKKKPDHFQKTTKVSYPLLTWEQCQILFPLLQRKAGGTSDLIFLDESSMENFFTKYGGTEFLTCHYQSASASAQQRQEQQEASYTTTTAWGQGVLPPLPRPR